MKKLRMRMEDERTLLDECAKESLVSEKTLAQSRLVDELIFGLYEGWQMPDAVK